MSDPLKIKVNIANRSYPLTIERNEEERVRKAVVIIRQAIERFEEKYAVSDKQDALAMTALQMANQMIVSKNSSTNVNEDEISERLRSLESQLDAVLSSVDS
jgi:cell division protein ZapA|nr:cell division ZapA family protein [uncultured bacterium]|tara:strand:- start:5332 stop:5637 length:306 start_codon:yes stop_codon:yes gene_type:complete